MSESEQIEDDYGSDDDDLSGDSRENKKRELFGQSSSDGDLGMDIDDEASDVLK